MGPAGFTLAHHLMNDGHAVVAVDGLKIEPLPPGLSGVMPDGTRTAFHPVRDVHELYENLDERLMAGFGGVAEYGITVRWDKNFLKVIRLLIERRRDFALFDGVRFGGTLTVEDALDLGFDHIALAAGAGRPTMLDLPNGLARGVRMASDFLMALQLTGAAKADSVTDLQMRLSGRGDRRRSHRHRHRYRSRSPTTRCRWRSFCGATRHWSSSTARSPCAARWRRGGADDRRRIHRPRPRDPRGAGSCRCARDALPATRAAAVLGRGDHRLSPPPDRQSVLHAQPRRGGEGPGGRHRVRRGPHAAARGGGRTRARAEPCVCPCRTGTWKACGTTTTRSSCPRARSSSPPARSPTPCSRARTRCTVHVDGRYFQACDENGTTVKPERSAKPLEPRVLLSRHAGRTLSELLRRPASLIRRQRREGDGEREAGLPGVIEGAGAATRGEPDGARRVLRAVEPRLASPREGSESPHADHRRGGGGSAARRAEVHARPVLPTPELRNVRHSRRWHHAADGRARAHGRASRSRTRPAFHDRARDGRLIGPLRAAQARRASRAHGSNGHADGDAGRRDRHPRGRRTRQRGTLLHWWGPARRGFEGALFRRLQEADRPLQGRRDRGRCRCGRLVLRRGAGIRAAPAAGPQLRRQHRAGDGGVCAW